MMIPDLAIDSHYYWIAGGVLVALLIARRVPVLGTLVSVLLWVGVAGALIVLMGRGAMLEPYLGRYAAMLRMDGQSVVGETVRIRMSADGHFWARVRIGDVERRMLIDSGATVTALSTTTAAAAGITPRDGIVPVLLTTANGTIRAQTATVPELRFGTIVARDLSVVVSPAFGGIDVLGMNFLSRLQSWRVEAGTLVMVPHHPQKVADDA